MNYYKLVFSYGVYNLKYFFTYEGARYARIFFYVSPIVPKPAYVKSTKGWKKWYTDEL